MAKAKRDLPVVAFESQQAWDSHREIRHDAHRGQNYLEPVLN
jgi:hypothetical protein